MMTIHCLFLFFVFCLSDSFLSNDAVLQLSVSSNDAVLFHTSGVLTKVLFVTGHIKGLWSSKGKMPQAPLLRYKTFVKEEQGFLLHNLEFAVLYLQSICRQ